MSECQVGGGVPLWAENDEEEDDKLDGKIQRSEYCLGVIRRQAGGGGGGCGKNSAQQPGKASGEGKLCMHVHSECRCVLVIRVVRV